MTKYKKGNTYPDMASLLPVAEASIKAWPEWQERPLWCRDSAGWTWSTSIPSANYPVTLIEDIPDGSERPKPLTVEEIREHRRQVWFVDPDNGSVRCYEYWQTKAALITYGVDCYATNADCQRANRFEVE
jgi:hypothetical protein